jgi:hypothetical protein
MTADSAPARGRALQARKNKKTIPTLKILTQDMVCSKLNLTFAAQ